ncbi:hypothetical protein ATANTOWER_017151, partial [Ataeniobius toweri]|nr:hypothetical protein [Ataeniobius toweri]
MDYYGFSLLIASLLTGASCQHLTKHVDEEFTLKGSSVTLSYNYSRKAAADDYFFWYRQNPGEPPEFLISHSGTGILMSKPVSGMSFK